MKYKLLVIIIVLSCMLSGCGFIQTVNEDGMKVDQLGNFIELSHVDYENETGFMDREYIVYDKDTKVVYYILYTYNNHSIALSEYYINNNGKAEVAIYGVNY